MSRKKLYINRDLVVERRKGAGFSSATALAVKLGLSGGYLNALLKSGEVGCMNAATLLHMAEVLGVQLDELVRWTEELPLTPAPEATDDDGSAALDTTD